MKRAPGLVEISRRDFCGMLGLASAAGVVLVGCGSSDPATPDAAPPDAAGPVCAVGAFDAGAPTKFMVGKPVYFAAKNLFVVRDAGGLYALSARCTHQGVTIAVSGTRFACPAHGATFDFNGGVLGGPTNTPLVHFAMCMLATGNVGVTTSTVSASTRLVA